ncbi:MAG: hypothetical protein JJU16_05260 [Alkalibacterium sp.]|nr:hypothetical protein [Alkalibacterium sp.]
MVYLYKKNDELIVLENQLSDSGVLRNQMTFEGAISREYYESVLNLTGCIFESVLNTVNQIMEAGK